MPKAVDTHRNIQRFLLGLSINGDFPEVTGGFLVAIIRWLGTTGTTIYGQTLFITQNPHFSCKNPMNICTNILSVSWQHRIEVRFAQFQVANDPSRYESKSWVAPCGWWQVDKRLLGKRRVTVAQQLCLLVVMVTVSCWLSNGWLLVSWCEWWLQI